MPLIPMTSTPQTPPRSDAPRHPSSPDRLPYEAPSLTSLGSVGTVTAGPKGGNLDQIFGGTGGFQEVDTTS